MARGVSMRALISLVLVLVLGVITYERAWANSREIIQEPRALLESNEPTTPGHLAVYFVEDNQSPVTRIITPSIVPNAQPLICDNNMIVEKAKVHFTFSNFTSECRYLGSDRWQIPGPQDVNPRESFIAAVISGIGNCAVTPESTCIASIEVTKKDKSVLKLSPVRPIHDHYRALPSTYDGETKTGYPGGDSPWIWKATDSDTEYLALGSVLTWYNRPGSKDRRSLNLNLYPVRQTPRVLTQSESLCGGGVATGSDFSIYCRLGFLDEEKFTVRLRIPNDISGWISGRLFEPAAYVERFNANYDEIVVTGGPVETIVAGKWIKVDSQLDAYFKNSIWWRGYEGSAKTRGGNTSWPGALVDIGNQSVKILNELDAVLGEKALMNVKTWSIALSTSNLPECSQGKSGIQGLVATNAAVYSSGAPLWDAATQTLTYEVASPHLRSDSSQPNIGNYGLTMPESLFKCIYRVERVPQKASVSISYAGGKDPIVTTVALNSRNEWVYLSADNFTFSSPVIRVKLMGMAPESQQQYDEKKSVVSSSVKKKTITCVKGKEKRKIPGKKCPRGFKKA